LDHSTTTASAQERYKIINLPTPAGSNSAALGLNDNGNVIAYSFQGDTYQAFLYFQNDGSSVDVGQALPPVNNRSMPSLPSRRSRNA
jgi:hypothetical protein